MELSQIIDDLTSCFFSRLAETKPSFKEISWFRDRARLGTMHVLHEEPLFAMSDYYQDNYLAYHKKTFSIDPSSFLELFAGRLAHGSLILDIGCGSGRDLVWLKKRGFTVVGFERSKGLAKLARENADCEVIEGDFETYDFSLFSVDAILASGTFVHLPHSRLSGVLKSVQRALERPKPQKALIVPRNLKDRPAENPSLVTFH